MNIPKLFNAWIASNFKGLSAHTLYQLLCSELDFLPLANISDMVHVDLYHVFTSSANDTERDTFATIKDIVNSCTWL